jgi:G:T/U-mismatch repair DNA glycosylase/ADP-ribose pyrophosphatase YjhB (NUDIX family)
VRADSVTPSEVPDVLAPDLRIVFCGINPGRVSAAAGAHFANPRNDFWRLLHAVHLTPRLLRPVEQSHALEYGIGLTNAAYRTTAGSADLRSRDYAGAEDRLGRIAAELRPQWLAFVGKEAYRGTFGLRAELGVQQRRLHETRLFVLPSTSPANAAVPWAERERWFQELAGRATGHPLRDGVRALVVDPADRVLLVRFEWPDKTLWAPPGGGVEHGETHEEAIRRELAEQCGLRDFDLGPCVWVREHWFPGMTGWGGQRERIHLVRSAAFEPKPEWSLADLAAEGVTAIRWWTPAELDASRELFAPRRLPQLCRDLLARGAPAEPVDAGI